VLYRTNAQSRALEDALRRAGVPYQIVGSVRFYERREIQDVLAYLRLISNPRDEGAFERVVNYPRRGIGDTSLERLAAWAQENGVSLLEAAARAEEIPEMRAAQGLRSFADLVQRYSVRAAQASIGELLEELIEELDLMRHLHDEGPEGEDRARNVAELIAGAIDFDASILDDQDPDDPSPDRFTELDLFLQQVALVADVDKLDPNAQAVTLMTLHNAKGLEFPLVFIAGMEEGLFPLARAYDEPAALEEERRLFYVGITRAEDKLILSWARQRRRAGDLTFNLQSSFLASLPPEHLESRRTQRLTVGAASLPHRRDRLRESQDFEYETQEEPEYTMNQDTPRFVKGERVVHATFGSGSVVEISGFGRDIKVTVDFDEVGRKKLLLRYAELERDWP
jgi:DNA helicase-2/ATP-dependent DNA helicase PcrA